MSNTSEAHVATANRTQSPVKRFMVFSLSLIALMVLIAFLVQSARETARSRTRNSRVSNNFIKSEIRGKSDTKI